MSDQATPDPHAELSDTDLEQAAGGIIGDCTGSGGPFTAQGGTLGSATTCTLPGSSWPTKPVVNR